MICVPVCHNREELAIDWLGVGWRLVNRLEMELSLPPQEPPIVYFKVLILTNHFPPREQFIGTSSISKGYTDPIELSKQ